MYPLELQLPKDFDKKLQKYLKKLGLNSLEFTQNNRQEEAQKTPKFKFSEGVLFRDFADGVLLFKNENDQEFILIKTAMGLPINEKIDAMTEQIDLKPRQIYDTAKRLNTKIKDTFGINDFFAIDFTNKYVKRVVE